jgi:type I restriction enzyme S subunit
MAWSGYGEKWGTSNGSADCRECGQTVGIGMKEKAMRLGNVITVNPESIRNGYPFEEIEYIDISSVGTGTLQGTQRLQIDSAPSRAKRIVRNGDTLLATVRPNLKSYWFSRNAQQNAIASTGFAVLRAGKEIDERFLYFTVTNQSFTDYLTANAKGAAYPAVDTGTLERAEIYLPPLPVQRKIAAILSAYDDLIENNLRRIKILEEMAQNLYREWFIKFRFPGYQTARFVDSPLGRIPEVWEITKVGDILKNVKRGIKIQKKDYAIEGAIPIVDQGKEFVGGYTDNIESLISKDLPLIIFGDHTRILKFIDFPFACGADGTQILKSNDERMPITLFYCALLSIDLSDFAYARHFKLLKEEHLFLPTKSIAAFFDQFVSPLREQLRSLMQKNTTLRRTRDLLLPRLISGELDVSELDITVSKEVL